MSAIVVPNISRDQRIRQIVSEEINKLWLMVMVIAAMYGFGKEYGWPAGAAVIAIAICFFWWKWMIAVAVPTSAYALILGARGYRAYHPLLIGIAGLGMLAAGTLIAGETRFAPITVIGAVILATAHILNWRRRHNL